MSLLLDALKKAAEKKAKKDSETTDAVDRTESIVDETETQEFSGQKDELTQTELMDRTSAEITETEVLHPTEFDADTADQTQIDVTEMDATQVDQTEMDATQVDQTAMDATQVDVTELDATEIQHEEPDLSELDATSIDQTAIDETQLEATELEATETVQVDEPTDDNTELDVTHSDHTATEVTEVTEDSVDTVFSTEDSTLFISDDEDALETFSQSGADETETITDQKLSQLESNIDELTNDDVTEFMGDGLREDSNTETLTRTEPVPEHEESASTDDTTITNQDSLSLTNIDQDEDLSLTVLPGDVKGHFSIEDPERTDTIQTRDQYVPEDEKETVLRSDNTSSTVDIEKLTSDETVTIKDSTATRTFAPDNYDRTLMKLSDRDVSRIFPGMKGESNTVMTPDYAKKIFMRKSSSVRSYYYKIYAGIAVSLLLFVIIWGLIGLQEESDSIDRSLAGLKRDPMPGIIKPKGEDKTANLFGSQSAVVDEKAIELLSGEGGSEVSVSPGDSSHDLGASLETASTEQPGKPDQDEIQKAASSQQAAEKTSTTVAAKTAEEKSNIQLFSSSKVSEKDELVQSAYMAYASGDLETAKQDYDRVLELDAVNRDALMGRAAIHVQDNEYEQAIQYYQALLQENPKDSVAMTSLISVANIDPKAGETQLKNMLREQPESPYLHFALGNMYGGQNRWSEAQSAYFNALHYKPDDPNYAYNMAVSLEHMGKAEPAISYYERAMDNMSSGLATFNAELVYQRIEVLKR